ncbi:hypothetical protein NI382_21625 [Vibrio parahaemolyticus]|nr:hypothetical protein NI382_21625 [Vibrio parahaemolyticus]
MKNEFDELLPNLEEFSMEDVPFKVVDPSTLPTKTLAAFDTFMAGASVPHRVFVYSQDYARFCMLVRRSDIKIS